MGSLVAQGAARMPVHHLDDALLLDYAAGAAAEAEALVVATHLTLCPVCRERLAELETIGGALFDEVPPVDLGPDVFDRLLARLDEPDIEGSDKSAAIASAVLADAPVIMRPISGRDDVRELAVLPAPLRAYVGNDVTKLAWRSVTRGIDELSLATRPGGAKARLMRIRAGAKVPSHTHEGSEITLVLAGGFADGRGHFLRGDVAISDHEVDHSPVADDDEDCICLAVTDAPLKLTGKLSRFLNPFVKF